MRSSNASANTNALASQYNDLRSDAYGGSILLPHQKSTPGMAVTVETGVFYIGGTKVAFAGGNSPTITAPVSHPRIDLLTIDTSGTLALVTGTEATSPVAPTYTTAKLVICEIYNAVGETIIYDNANQTAGQGYITDVRPFLTVPQPTYGGDQAGTWVAGTTYTNTTGRPQIHILTVVGTVGNGSSSGNIVFQILVNGTVVAATAIESAGVVAIADQKAITFVVPSGATFELVQSNNGVVVSGGPNHWFAVNL